ncbi:two-component system sensor histidine kinase CreC [Pseudomonas sp. KNUC1026]|uniref:two-component system sensor histidine kinase CreC n=1 Tax=Pseudomonas sp. KNUC1026 TaxID=2893890 RepID=UPI001F3F0BCD|nr:two-component system sensor histidine kinase CreC [Pseudomonas sp. KNUC1026]UFH48693.1 two-component system sensor histidine kinase CreC [Pseudomonas sp. KNUC1026]
MPLGIRIFLVYFLFVGLTGWFVLNAVTDEIRPGVRQSTEETLVDTANLLAELVRDDVKAGTLAQGHLPAVLKAYGQRQPGADIWGLTKNSVNHRIYVTDARGIVLLDSLGLATGQDYSRWNDVYLTLQGQYGARSTRENADDPASSVMYVGAPIIDGGQIIGVVTVAKPNATVQPYVERSEQRLRRLGIALVVLGLMAGGLLAWWMTRSLRRLSAYALAASEGQRVALPRWRTGGEMAQLAGAVEHMRTQLEGKAYVERYVLALTHELKSPLAAIRGAAELLHSDMPAEARTRFVENIDSESARIQRLVERLLDLAQVEQRQALEAPAAVRLAPLAQQVVQAQAARVHSAGLVVTVQIADHLAALGDAFLLSQAVGNLVENALAFMPDGASLHLSAEALANNRIRLNVFNEGPSIPDYALPRLTERFYSLPRPSSGRKSSGLGLSFVAEVMTLHNGQLVITNAPNGVLASLELPAA